MSIDNSGCVRSKYFVGRTAMDESLSDFQEAKQSCKGPKPAQKPSKPKTRKVTKRIKGQKDIRAALKGNKNDLLAYAKDFDTVCKKSGLDVDSEQLQLAIALSKSLQTESSGNSESSPTLSSQQRVAKIRKTLQEYGFKVPEAKITQNKKTKKHRKQYKLLLITEEERRQIITGKYSQILFQNSDNSRLSQNSSNQVSDARVFYIAANVPYECMKDNKIFYVHSLIEKSTTTGLLLRDWSEIPGRPESPKLFDTYTMNFQDIDCSQDELDVILSGSIKSTKDIFATKQIAHKSKIRGCDVPKIVIDDDEEKVASEDGVSEIDGNSITRAHIDHQTGVTEIRSPFQKAFEVKSPTKKVFQMKSPVNNLFEVKPPVTPSIDEAIEIKSPAKEAMRYNNPFEEEVKDVESNNKLTLTHTQKYRSCSPDLFEDEISSIIETTKPINVLSQEHKTKVFTEDNFMDLTHCANVLSQNSEKSNQLSQNFTKRKSNDFMEITECIVGSSQPIREELKEIDLTQSPADKDVVLEENRANNVENNKDNVSLVLSSTDIEENSNDSIIENIINEENVTVVNIPKSKDLQENEEYNIDLTQSSNEDKGIADTEENNLLPEDKRQVQNMDLTQSSNSDNIDDLPLVDVGNSQTGKSLDDTIIINEDEYIANGKVKKSMILENEPHNKVFDLTQAQDNSVEYDSSPIKNKSTEPCSSSFYEDFVHDHSANTGNSNGSDQNVSIEDNNNSHDNKSKESIDIDLTQASDTSEERPSSPRPITVLENIPNNSSLGKRDDVSIDYDEILIDDMLIEKESFIESENDNSLNLKYDSFKSDATNEIEIVDANDDVGINSSQNSEVFNISDKELDYSLHKSRHDIPRDNFDFGGISVLDNVTKLSFRKSLSEGCQSIVAKNKNLTMGESFLPEVIVKKTDDRSKDTAQTDTQKPVVTSLMKLQDVFESNNGLVNVKTPKNSEYIIKTDDVTPMADYSSMSTPQRNRELDRYGLKPFKRKRAIQILTHLYNQTHPTIQQLVDEDQPSPSKKPRQDTYTPVSSPMKPMTSPRSLPLKKTGQIDTHSLDAWPLLKTTRTSPLKKNRQNINPQASPRKIDALEGDKNIISEQSPVKSKELERDGDIICAPSPRKAAEVQGVIDMCGYEVTSEYVVVKSVDCHPDDWVFQKREKAKIHSCRVPLHIAFHNYVLSRRSLREAILKYEPVNIDVIHKDLVGYGHRYDPKDLLKFLDKKCITVKTTENNSRNNKR